MEEGDSAGARLTQSGAPPVFNGEESHAEFIFDRSKIPPSNLKKHSCIFQIMSKAHSSACHIPETK
jgi:hypothetical protein